MKGKAFKLNNHPADYFDHNPFKRVNINKPAEAEGQKVKLKAWFTPFHLTQLGRSNLESLNICGTLIKITPFQTISPSNRCFQSYPMHSYDPYVPPKKQERKINKPKGLFMPTSGPKSCPTPSVTQQNILKSVNQSNYKTIRCLSKL